MTRSPTTDLRERVIEALSPEQLADAYRGDERSLSASILDTGLLVEFNQREQPEVADRFAKEIVMAALTRKLGRMVRVADREDGRAWAVEVRESPLETWDTLPRRFTDRAVADAYATEVRGTRVVCESCGRTADPEDAFERWGHDDEDRMLCDVCSPPEKSA